MAPLILSPRQRLELEYFVSHTPVAKERCRAQAWLWLDDGESAAQVPRCSPSVAGRSLTGGSGSTTAPNSPSRSGGPMPSARAALGWGVRASLP